MNLDVGRLKRVTIVWLMLVLATAISWQLGHGTGLENRHLSGLVILLIAVLKARLLILDFMELRHAPMAFRIAVEGWSLATGIAMASLYSK